MTLDQFTPDSRALTLIMAQLLSVMLALSPGLLAAGQDVLGLGEVKHVMAGEEYNVRQLSKVQSPFLLFPGFLTKFNQVSEN